MRPIARLALALAAGLTLQPLAAQPVPPSRVIANIGLQGSEAARLDEKADVILVTNLGARGPGNDGFVSRFSPDGDLIALKWIEGGKNGVTLVDPLGIFIKGDTIYIADTTSIRLFNRETGAPRREIAVPGAVRLNDLSVDDKGEILVTDSGSDDAPGALYRISAKGEVSVFAARNPALERPNGIAHMPDGSIVHGGRGVNLVFRSADGAILREVTLPNGRTDGIIPLADGSLLVASQEGKNVYRLSPSGKAEVVAQDIAVPAAIGYDAKRRRLLVPQIVASSLSLYDLP